MEGEDEEAPGGEARPETALSTEYPSDGDAVICKIREHEESIQAPDGKFESSYGMGNRKASSVMG